jgi:tetratricopeptide (TPR) repeat protein
MEYVYNKFPLNSRVINNLSYFYSTCPEVRLRKPSLALKLAKKAVKESNWLNAAYIDTLAAAYFVNGNRRKALELQKRALLLNPIDEDFIKNLKKYGAAR